MPPADGKASAFSEGFIARVARGLGYIATGRPQDWFGPLDPMTSIAPPEVAGRQFDYPVGFNLALGPRAYEPVGFPELRALADAYDLIRAIVETRKDQLERLRWQIRRRDSAVAHDPRIAEIEAFFARPDRVHWWSTWLRMLVEDLLVIDAPALYLRRTRGGRLYALEPLDGATVKRVIDDFGRTPAPPAPAYQQILKGMPAVDYTTEDLLYFPRNVRVHKVYGFSPVEQIQMTVNIALRRQLYQLQYYTEGNIPEALIGVPENWNPDQIRQFQAYWDSLHEGNTAERRHAKFVPGGVAKTFIPTREPVLKDVFDEWLARICCFAFSISPQPFVQQLNRATAESAHDAALAEGLLPLQNWVKQLVDYVILTEFGAPDLEFAWADDRESDPEKAAAIAVQYVKAGIKSVNEVRAELGLDPVSGGDVPSAAPSPAPQEGTEAYGGMHELGKVGGGWNPEKHPRWPQRTEGGQGGRFRPVSDSGTEGGTDEASGDEKDSDAENGGRQDSFEAFLAGTAYSPQARELLKQLYRLMVDGQFNADLPTTKDLGDLRGKLELGVKDLPIEAESALDPPKPLSELMTKKPPMGFQTWAQLRAYLGPPPKGYQWHHIIEQSQVRPDLTTPEAQRNIIQNTNNMVLIPTIRHYWVTALLNRPAAPGPRLRDDVHTLPADDQRLVGLHLLEITRCWNGQ